MERKKIRDCLLRYEGDTDVEKIFKEEIESESDMEVNEADYLSDKKKGTIPQSHYLSEGKDFTNFVPSSDDMPGPMGVRPVRPHMA